MLRSRLIVIAHDVLMIPIAWLLAYWLRFNLANIPVVFLKQAFHILPWLMLLQLGAYQLFGLYRGIWRFASLPDLMRIIKAVLLCTLLLAMVLYVYSNWVHLPRSIFPLYAILLIGLLSGSRLGYRGIKDSRNRSRSEDRVLIIGAGAAAEALLRDMLRDPQQRYQPIGLLDDNIHKTGQELHGVRILGVTSALPKLIKKLQIKSVIIAIPSATATKMREWVAYCEKAQVPCHTLPALLDLASGRVSVNALREVSLEDLLGRDPVNLDWQKIAQNLHNKIVLVTGGGGSIGSELCRQIAKYQPACLIVFENSEYNLYELTLELQRTYPQLNFHGHLVDVLDQVQITQWFEVYKPEIVFHAAAYKHVPMLEAEIRAALRNNVLGTQLIAMTAVQYQVQKFVLISTDKAVNPSNIMGASKRAAEIFCQNYSAHTTTQFITVRFGNVLGSAGSVVPLFRKQLQQGGPITVTHPEITRYFMTIPEAVQLILQAMVLGTGGEIFVLDMGEPVKIRYLAEQLIQLSGKQPNKDIQIIYTGLRPGEKLHEELFHASEALENTEHEQIKKARYREWDWQMLLNNLEILKQACAENDLANMTAVLSHLVPEYVCSE